MLNNDAILINCENKNNKIKAFFNVLDPYEIFEFLNLRQDIKSLKNYFYNNGFYNLYKFDCCFLDDWFVQIDKKVKPEKLEKFKKELFKFLCFWDKKALLVLNEGVKNEK
ncbi:hypothetical protein ACWXVO_03120 [Mycoplasma sp. 1890]